MLMIKPQKKKKTTSSKKSTTANTNNTITIQKPIQRPEWNSTISDPDKYKLSQAELIQKKISLMSKHKMEAKELWARRQEKLQKGVIDEETKSIIDTCMSTKRPPERNQKNITYFIRKEEEEQSKNEMLLVDDNDEAVDDNDDDGDNVKKSRTVNNIELQEDEEEDENEDDEGRSNSYSKERKNHGLIDKRKERKNSEDKVLMKKIEKDLKETREFIKRMDKCKTKSNGVNPEKVIKIDEEARKSRSPVQKSRKSYTKTKSIDKKKINTKGEIKNNKMDINKDGMLLMQDKTNSRLISPKKEAIVDENNNNNKCKSPNLTKIEEGNFSPGFSHNNNAYNGENDEEDITVYFKSLNRIEDTIKFLEERIICDEPIKDKDTEKVKTKDNSSANNNNVKVDKTWSSPISNSPIKNFYGSPELMEFPEMKTNKIPLGKPISPLKKRDLTVVEEKTNTKDNDDDGDEQISFSLTMKSSENGGDNNDIRDITKDRIIQENLISNRSIFDKKDSSIKFTGESSGGGGSSNSDDKLGSSNQIYRMQKETYIHPFTNQNVNGVFPQVIMSKGTMGSMSMSHATQQQQQQGSSTQAKTNYNAKTHHDEDDNDDEELEIEKIRQLLKATQEDIAKMNSLDFSNPLYRSTQQKTGYTPMLTTTTTTGLISEYDIKQNGQQGKIQASEVDTMNRFRLMNNFVGDVITPSSNNNTQPLYEVTNNTNMIIGNMDKKKTAISTTTTTPMTNCFGNFDDDELPMPRNFTINKYNPISFPSKYTDENSLCIKNFIKK